MMHLRGEGCNYCAPFRWWPWLCQDSTRSFFSLSSCLFPCQLRRNNNHALCVSPYVRNHPNTKWMSQLAYQNIILFSQRVVDFSRSWFLSSWIAVAASQNNSYFIAWCWWNLCIFLHWYEICFSIFFTRFGCGKGENRFFCVRGQLLHGASALHRET